MTHGQKGVYVFTKATSFEDRYMPEPMSGCWLYLGMLDAEGYGFIRKGIGKSEQAHRESWRRYKGVIPEGIKVLHKCDNPCCINPDHLFLGTQLENIKDRDQKGRVAKGKIHYKATVLTEELVKWILNSDLSNSELSKLCGVSRKYIGGVRRREVWKHIKV